MTNGLYTEIVLVAGSNIAACTKADCAVFDSLQGPWPGSVATSWYGVASPAAVSGSAGTISVQLGLGTAGGGGAFFAAFCICALRSSVPGDEDAPVCAEAAWQNKDVMHSNSLAVAMAWLLHGPLELRVR